MKPTLLFAFCALIMLVSAAPAQSPQRDPAREELTALIKEVRAQQAAVAAIRPRSTKNSPPWPKLFGSREFIPVAEADDAKSANIHNHRGNTYRCCHWCCPNSPTDTGPDAGGAARFRARRERAGGDGGEHQGAPGTESAE